ncbi:hypothetical protein KP509_27G067300 [Ceratopteris richardii]|uniref:GOST seven transmembrane domain-containing protein n=2 Tax=Ceratopteris richardii TaxID=49495 RepID=A0A8T2RIP5_CERRI|nr:hypothetical protein KP509_27G067300 [Ceratopteris richardii]
MVTDEVPNLMETSRRSYLHMWIVVFAFAALEKVQGSVHQYSAEQFKESQNGFLFYGGSEGMHASTSKDVNKAGVANGRSYIRFDAITFRLQTLPSVEDSPSKGLIQAVIFETADRNNVGRPDSICCTPDLARTDGCKEGEVIVRLSSEVPQWPLVISIRSSGDRLEVFMPTESVNISRTGFYNVFFVVCDPQLRGLTIEGSTAWKNPTGYLPGSMAPLLQFYGIMSFAYIVLGFIWFLQYLKFWENTSKLQSHITLIIALGMLEMTLWYFEYANFNATGRRAVRITFWPVTFGALKKTLSRLLLLGVSMGYGIVRPNLGGQTVKVVALSITYLLAVEFLDMSQNVGAINDLSGRLLLVLPVAVLDALFILWIFVSLSKILEEVEAQRWLAKLEFYRKLTNTLTVFVLIAVAWIGYEFYFKSSDSFGEGWQKAWIISGFWNILTFVFLSVLCVLLAPSSNPAKFDYIPEATRGLDKEEAVSLNSVVVEQEKATSKSEKKLLSTAVFSLDENSGDEKKE